MMRDDITMLDVAALLSGLPIATERRAALGYHVHQLTLVMSTAWVRELPSAYPSGSAKGAEQVHELRGRLSQALDLLATLGQEADTALREDLGKGFADAVRGVAAMAEAAGRAHAKLAAQPRAHSQGGRPRANGERNVVIAATWAYEALTGRPTGSKEHTAFLCRAFRLLDVSKTGTDVAQQWARIRKEEKARLRAQPNGPFKRGLPVTI